MVINDNNHHHVQSQLLKELKVEKEQNTKNEMRMVELKKELTHAQHEIKALTSKLEEVNLPKKNNFILIHNFLFTAGGNRI